MSFYVSRMIDYVRKEVDVWLHRALEAYVLAREKEAKAAWDRGELPF